MDEDFSTAWEKTNFLEKRGDTSQLKRKHKYYTHLALMSYKNT